MTCERDSLDYRIDEVTNRWFEETASSMSKYVSTDSVVDRLLCGVVPLAHNYCNAVFLLANQDYRLPAMALLRVLAELSLRVIWCMFTDNPHKQSPEERIMRWLKTTNDDEIRHLKKVLPAVTPPNQRKIRQAISCLEAEQQKNRHSGTGPFYNSLDELPKPYKVQIHPLLYGRFNQAIHPNLTLLHDLVRQTGPHRLVLNELQVASRDTLKIYGMTAAFNILAIVRLHYGWDHKKMKAEYLDIKRQRKEKAN